MLANIDKRPDLEQARCQCQSSREVPSSCQEAIRDSEARDVLGITQSQRLYSTLEDELMLEEVARVLHDLEASQDGIPLT